MPSPEYFIEFGDFDDLDTGQDYQYFNYEPDSNIFIDDPNSFQEPYQQSFDFNPFNNQKDNMMTDSSLSATPNVSSGQCINNNTLSDNSDKSTTIQEQKNQSFEVERSTKRGKMALSSTAHLFKENYYHIFTKKKKFPKPFVKKIHKLIEGPLNLKPFTRSISRCNDKYFIENAYRSEDIIQYLCSHKLEIIALIPELGLL